MKCSHNRQVRAWARWLCHLMVMQFGALIAMPPGQYPLDFRQGCHDRQCETGNTTKYPWAEICVYNSWEKDDPEASRLNDTIQPAPTGFGTFGSLVNGRRHLGQRKSFRGQNLVFELVDPLLGQAWSWWLELFGRWSNVQATGPILKVKWMELWVDWQKCHWDVCFKDGLVMICDVFWLVSPVSPQRLSKSKSLIDLARIEALSQRWHPWWWVGNPSVPGHYHQNLRSRYEFLNHQ